MMKIKTISAIALLLSYAGNTFASLAFAPEIDGALSLQAVGLLAGVLFLMKRKNYGFLSFSVKSVFGFIPPILVRGVSRHQ